MKISRSILILVLITLSACQRKPMSNLDFESQNHKLFFVRAHDDGSRLTQNVFLKQHSHFYIDDIDILNKIKNDFIKEESETKEDFIPDYNLYLFDDTNKEVFNGKIDLINGLLHHNDRYYDFKSGITIIPEVSFKPVEKFKIDMNSIRNGRKLVKLIEDNHGFSKVNDLNNIIGTPYNGMTILQAKKDYLETHETNQRVIEKVENDLKGLGEVKVAVSYCNTPEYCTFYVYSEKLNSDAIPSEYEIIKPLSDSLVNRSLFVYNISGEQLNMIMDENHIEMEVIPQ